MPRPFRLRPILHLTIAAAIGAGLSGCLAAPPPSADAAAETPEPEAAAACIQRARVIDVEEAREYHEQALVGLRAEQQYMRTFNGRYVIGFDEETFWVEPAYDFWLSDGTAIVDVRQSGRLTGRYTLEDGVLSTSDVVDGRTSVPAVDAAAGPTAAIVRRIMDHNPIEGARASCEGDDLVLELSEPDSGHTTVHLPGA
ncbi:hypothetical protein [Agromyces albus]|uniref:Uncharacterized protein n=1 Tax=Agromyces albus TaxID=205332 RepID=A0A4Q2L3G9_9MICO|nr:hypothetical protein [Agromyces albus]RXZ72698.1 hypothetical protein ESP51_02535 [Agromyces albus]